MSWIDALHSAIESAVLWRRRQRKRQKGRHDWWHDEWRLERAHREGIRFSDEELRQMLWTDVPLSYNEAKRIVELTGGQGGSHIASPQETT